MSDNNSFKRGKKRGMRFKPSGGFNRRPSRSGIKARADVESVKTAQDEIYNTREHEHEIVRSENKAHGLSPNADLESAKAQRQMNNKVVVETFKMFMENDFCSTDSHSILIRK